MIFLLCAAGVVYVLAGYPLLLALLASLRPKPVHKAPYTPSVSVMLPVHNGERWLARKLESIFALDYPQDRMQVLVISDGSTDRTKEIASGYPVEYLEISKGGKALALNRAILAARGEILFFTDVRQSLDPAALRHLTDCFADPEVGVATGELIILDGQTQEEANVGLYWKYEKWIRRRLSKLDSVLGATGCIYAMRRELARPLPAGTLLDDVHQPLYAFFAGYRIVMEERALAYDVPTGLETEFWRKIRTQAGLYQLLGHFPAILWPGTRMWLHFASHKYGRLLLPFLLLGMGLGAFFLPDPWRVGALTGQGIFYGLALLNRWIPGRGGLKTLTAAASAFVVLVGAALCGAAILFVPAERLWRPR